MAVWEIVKLVAVVFFSFASCVFAFALSVKAKREKRKAQAAMTEAERLEHDKRALELEQEADELIEKAIQDVETAFKATGIVNGVAQKTGTLKKRLVMSEAQSFLASNGAKIDAADLSKKIDDKVAFMNTNKK